VAEQARSSYQLILDKYESFSSRQKKVADYVMTNIHNAIYLPIAKMVAAIGVSQATMVRFAQSLGYNGFQEFRDALFAYYRDYLSPAERMKHSIESLEAGPPSYAAITRKEIVYLESSIHSINDEAYTGAVQAICDAATVYIFGIGPDQPLAAHLHFRLRRLKVRSQEVSASGRNLFEHLLLLGEQDLAVLYSFARPSEDCRRIVAVLAEKKVPVVLITDIANPAMMRSARWVLRAERGPLGTFPSPLVPMAITNALILGVANRMEPQALRALEELGRLRDRYFYAT
jgi:DNA-binding MurR/RpiR family transcriptional regulator